MKIELRNGKVHISGYVNAVGRDSRPIPVPGGTPFVEMIEPGTFREALTRADNVDMLLNHDSSRVLASTRRGDLSLTEDNIGLHADCEITDAEVIRSAKSGNLQGWSFGFYVNDDSFESRDGNIPRRHVRNIDLFEVSIIDSRMTPAYAGTSVECRADKNITRETRSNEDVSEIIDSGDDRRQYWQKRIDELKIIGVQQKIDRMRVDKSRNCGIIEGRGWITDKNGNHVYLDGASAKGTNSLAKKDSEINRRLIIIGKMAGHIKKNIFPTV